MFRYISFVLKAVKTQASIFSPTSHICKKSHITAYCYILKIPTTLNKEEEEEGGPTM